MEDFLVLLFFGCLAAAPILLAFGYLWLSSRKRLTEYSKGVKNNNIVDIPSWAIIIRNSKYFRNCAAITMALMAGVFLWSFAQVIVDENVSLWLISVSLSIGLMCGWLLYNRKVILFSALLFLIFPFYNIWILDNCSGDCSIRIDMIIIMPLLLFFAIAAFITIGREAWQRKNVPHDIP